MAGRILANLIVMGSTILGRAFIQAYRQALAIFGTRVSAIAINASWADAWFNADASKSGVAQETIQNTMRKGSKVMTEQEARQILGVTEDAAWEEVLKRYDTLFERNAKSGSFYIQSKVHRAKERLETVYRGECEGKDTPS